MVDQRNPWPRLPKWLQKFVRISLCKHNKMSLFLLNGSQLEKTNRAAICLKQPPKKLFHVSRDKILHNSWSISAALPRGFSDLPFWMRRRPWGWGCSVSERTLPLSENFSPKYKMFFEICGVAPTLHNHWDKTQIPFLYKQTINYVPFFLRLNLCKTWHH